MNQEELQRLFLRLQETRNDELRSLLTQILPGVIPLTSQESVRTDAIKVITEALRRTKLASIKLPLDVFTSLLQPQYLPFGCNFAIAFLDGLSDINCLDQVNTESISRLIQAWISFDLFSYQSNSIAAYLLKFNSFIPSAMKLLHTLTAPLFERANDLIYDFFIDILLYPVVALGTSSVPAGLSQSRVNRLTAKHKNLSAIALSTWKLQITELINEFDGQLEYKVIAGLLASNDKTTHANNDLQSFGKKLLNQAKETFLREKTPTSSPFNLSLMLNFVMSGMKALQGSSSIILSKDRVLLSKDLQFIIFDYVQKNLDWLPLPDINLMIKVFSEYTSQSTLSHSEAGDRLLKGIVHLFVDTFEKTNKDQASHLIAHIPQLLTISKTILSQYAFSSTSGVHHQSSAVIELKNFTYDLLYQCIAEYDYPLITFISHDILNLLLSIALIDYSTSNSTLFKVLDAIEERWTHDLLALAPQLEQQIKGLGNSPKSSYRLLYIKWIRKLYGWNSFVFSEMWKFAGDSVDLVSNFSVKQFQEVKKSIKNIITKISESQQEIKNENNEELFTIYQYLVQFLEEMMQSQINVESSKASSLSLFGNKATQLSLSCLATIQMFYFSADSKKGNSNYSEEKNPFALPEISLWNQVNDAINLPKQLFRNHRNNDIADSASVSSQLLFSLLHFLEKKLKQDTPTAYQALDSHQLRPSILHEMIVEEDSMNIADLLSIVFWYQIAISSHVSSLDQKNSDEISSKLKEIVPYRLISRVMIANALVLTASSTLTSDYYALLNNSSDSSLLTTTETQLQQLMMKARLSTSATARQAVDSSSLVQSFDAVALEERTRRSYIIFNELTSHWLKSTSAPALIEEITLTETISSLTFLLNLHKRQLSLAQQSIHLVISVEGLKQTLLELLDKKNSSYVSVASIACLNALVSGNRSQLPSVPSAATSVFDELFRSEFIQNKDRLLYFAIAENLSQQIIIADPALLTASVSEEAFLATNVMDRLERLIGAENKSEEKESLAVIVLVFLFTWNQFPGPLRFGTLERLLSCIIPFLKENNPFLRDIITLCLISLYQLTVALHAAGLVIGVTESILTYQSLEEYVSQEIVVAITRRKRPAQRVGFAAGGGSSVRNNNGNSSGNNNNGDDDSSAMNVSPDELLEAVMNNEANDANTLLRGMIASTNNNSNNNAANNPATNTTNPGNNTNNNQTAALDAGYSAYEKVCNITKKTGNGTVLMTALSIVKFDISFGQNQTLFLSKIYRAASFTIPADKVLDLIPMLYVAKYDPIPSIRDIMTTVWNKLIGIQEKDKLLQYATAILVYIDKNLLNPLWRERESAGYALESLLLLNLSWKSTLKPIISSLLEKGFKLLDDIRESTRKLAINIMKKLLQIILSVCNSKETANEPEAIENINIVFPILLNKGWISPSIEARGFCLGAMIKILNEEPVTVIIPWLERLIDLFIESISALEPQMLQYMEFHSSSLQVNREDLEKLRITLSQQSPVHEALKKCLNMVPFELLGNVCSIAYRHLSHGVGLATRVSAADTFTYLAEKFPSGMAKYGIKAMEELCVLISERPNLEASLKKSLIHALGMLAKVVEPSILNSECEELVQKYILYLKEVMIQQYSSSANQEIAYAIVIQQILKKAGERLQYSLSLWLYLMGISYCGSFDADSEVSHVWLDIFMTSLECSGIGNKLSAIEKSFPRSVNSSNDANVMMMTMDKMILYYLNHASWEKRKQGVRILKDIFTQMAIQPSLKDLIFSSPSFSLIIVSMMSLLPGMIWQGQEQLMEGLSSLFAALPSDFFSFALLPSEAIENVVVDFPASSCAAALLNEVQYPFSLSFMLPSSTSSSSSIVTALIEETIIVSSQEKKKKKKESEEESHDGSKPMEVDSPVTISIDPDIASPMTNRNVEIYKVIRERILFKSLEELRLSIEAVIVGRTPRHNTTSISTSTSTASSISDNVKDQWRVNVNALLSLLFYEIKRGDVNYRVIVGQTLVSLPWKEIQSQNPAIFLQHFPTLLTITELNYQEKESDAATAVTDTSPKTAKEEPKKAAPAHKNSLLFGSRYGAAVTTTATKKSSSSVLKNNTKNNTSPVPAPTATILPAKKTFSSPPAVRMHIIDCLRKGWLSRPESEEDQLIVKNITEFYDQEVWSIKRAYLLLLGAMGSKLTNLSLEVAFNMMKVIEKSQAENKFTQVKLGGLEALEQLLKGENQGMMKQYFSEKISKLVKQGALDPQPLVLEFIAKLQHLSL